MGGGPGVGRIAEGGDSRKEALMLVTLGLPSSSLRQILPETWPKNIKTPPAMEARCPCFCLLVCLDALWSFYHLALTRKLAASAFRI